MPVFLIFIFLFGSLPVSADVRFITETENTADHEKFQNLQPQYTPPQNDFVLDDIQRCKAEGYIYEKCDSGMFLADPCPYKSNIYANCCPQAYHYTAAECKALGKNLGAYSCGGYYKCE